MAYSISNPHNYYPLWVQLPHYVANQSPVISLIISFGLQWGAVIGASFFIIGRFRPKAGLSDRIAFTWMCLSMFSLSLEAIAEMTRPNM